MRFRDLETGADLPDEIPGTYYGTAWAADNRTFFYVKPDEAMRPYQLWRHVVGSPLEDDVLVYEEDDERFFLGVGTTKDERYVILGVGSKVTDEVRYLDAVGPRRRVPGVPPAGAGARVRRRAPRRPLPHRHQRRRGRGLQAHGGARHRHRPGPTGWTSSPHRPGVKLSGIDVFADHLVLFERAEGLRRIRIRRAERRRRPRHRPARGGVDVGGRGQPGVRHHGAALRLHVDGHAVVGLRLRHGHPGAGAEEAPARARRLRPVAVHDRAAVGHGRGRDQGADLDRVPQRPAHRRLGAGPALRLRLLRGQHGPGLLGRPAQPARPRLPVRHRPHPGRRRAGPALVPGGQVPGQAQHLHRLRGLRRAPRGRGLDDPRPAGRPRRVGRRAADGGGGQPAARPVRRRRGRGPVRRRPEHHPRPDAPAHGHGVGGVGQPGGVAASTTPT